MGAQVAQFVINRFVLPEANSFEAGLAADFSSAGQLRQLLILVSFFGLPVVFGAVAWVRFAEQPGAALSGFVFGLIFAITELLYRGLELFLVTRRWAGAYLASEPLARSVLGAKIETWQDLVGGWYFVLLSAHFLASIGFVLAMRRVRDVWDRALQVAFGANAVRLVFRLLGGFAGIAALGRLSSALYFPAVLAIFATVACWLVHQARTARRDPT